MLRDDPIVQRHPECLPTEEEVNLTEDSLRRPENAQLWGALCQRVCIAGCPRSTLLRFCWQAREEGLVREACAKGAMSWFGRCLEARERLKMDSILHASPFSRSFRDLYVNTVPFSYHGTDRQGHPILILRAGRIDITAFRRLWAEGERLAQEAGLKANAVVLFYLRGMEYLTKVVMQEETNRQGRTVDRILSILDLAGMNLGHIGAGSFRGFLQGICKESVLLYPETLHAQIVAHTPWIVCRAGWPIARKLMRPVTQEKMVFLNSPEDVSKKLLDLVHKECLPPYYGGTCNCAECRLGKLRGGSLWLWDKDKEAVKSPVVRGNTTQDEDGFSEREGCLGSFFPCCSADFRRRAAGSEEDQAEVAPAVQSAEQTKPEAFCTPPQLVAPALSAPLASSGGGAVQKPQRTSQQCTGLVVATLAATLLLWPTAVAAFPWQVVG